MGEGRFRHLKILKKRKERRGAKVAAKEWDKRLRGYRDPSLCPGQKAKE